MRANILMEVSLVATWLATLVWLGLGIYVVILKKRTEENSHQKLDKRPSVTSSVSKSPGATSVRDMDSLVLDSLLQAAGKCQHFKHYLMTSSVF